VTKAEIWRLIGRIVQYYPSFAAKTEEEDELRAESWHDVLRDVPYDLAVGNLRRYVSNPENRWPPHPGVLAANLESERYHEQMSDSGRKALKEHDRRLAAAVPPPEEISRKVREILAIRGTD
jgi:hypothetical protein